MISCANLALVVDQRETRSALAMMTCTHLALVPMIQYMALGLGRSGAEAAVEACTLPLMTLCSAAEVEEEEGATRKCLAALDTTLFIQVTRGVGLAPSQGQAIEGLEVGRQIRSAVLAVATSYRSDFENTCTVFGYMEIAPDCEYDTQAIQNDTTT
jgi:hypothetical protein